MTLGKRDLQRLAGVDLFRFFAFVGVVFIHTLNYNDQNAFSAGQFLVGLSHFAVPYFFIVSGYFLRDMKLSARFIQIVGRLGVPFLFWGAFYCLLFNRSIEPLFHIRPFCRFLYTGSPGYHLWFLPALISAVLIFTLLRRFCSWPVLFAVAAGLYLAGLLIGPWHDLIGLASSPFRTRNGPWFSTFFVAIGAWLRLHPLGRLQTRYAIVFVVAAASGQLAENFLMLRLGAFPTMSGSDVTAMTLPFGVAVFLLALSFSPGRSTSPIANLGSSTFGMYLIHPTFVYVGQQIVTVHTLWDRLAIAIFSIVLSVISIIILERIPFLKKVIS